MGSIRFSASKGRITAEIHAEGDPYGHDGCDESGCHWDPNAYETLYMTLEDAKKLRRELDAAIKQAKGDVR